MQTQYAATDKAHHHQPFKFERKKNNPRDQHSKHHIQCIRRELFEKKYRWCEQTNKCKCEQKGGNAIIRYRFLVEIRSLCLKGRPCNFRNQLIIVLQERMIPDTAAHSPGDPTIE